MFITLLSRWVRSTVMNIVSVSLRIWKTTQPHFTKVFVQVDCGCDALCTSGLWLMSCFDIIGTMACHTPPLTWNINPQSFHYNNVKMKLPIILRMSSQELSQVLPKSLVKSCIATPYAMNGLTCFVCYYLHSAHCRRIHSLSCGYATSTPQLHMLLVHYIALSNSLPSPPKKY